MNVNSRNLLSGAFQWEYSTIGRKYRYGCGPMPWIRPALPACPAPHTHQIPAAAVDLAAIGLVGPGRSTVVGDLFDGASIYLIQEICIIPAEAVDVRHIRLFKQLVDISYILLASLICVFANLTLYLCIFK